MAIMIAGLLAILGIILGSFVNAFVWRLHEKEELLEKKRKPSRKQLAELSILKGRSMCVHCRHELAAKDLVPLFSWLWLRGKCRYCHKPISWQYPVVELVTALLFGVSAAVRPEAVFLAFWLVFVVAFMALAVYDLRWYLLPNKIVYPLIGLAVIEVVVLALQQRSLSILVNAALGALCISGLFYVLFQVSNGSWIGGGDVKLAVVLGLLAGTPAKALLLLFFSSFIGTFVSLPLALQAKKGLKMRIPYGPFLLAATVITVLFGTAIIDWYTSKLL